MASFPDSRVLFDVSERGVTVSVLGVSDRELARLKTLSDDPNTELELCEHTCPEGSEAACDCAWRAI